MSTEELKPCPFCGGAADVTKNHRTEHYISCTKCDADGPFEAERVAAVIAWNNRTPGTGTTASAAGTIDTPELRRLMDRYNTLPHHKQTAEGFTTPKADAAEALIAHINQWGAALAEEARREADLKARNDVAQALGLLVGGTPNGIYSFAWSYLLGCIGECVKLCDEMEEAAPVAEAAAQACPNPAACDAQGCVNPRGRCEEAAAQADDGLLQRRQKMFQAFSECIEVSMLPQEIADHLLRAAAPTAQPTPNEKGQPEGQPDSATRFHAGVGAASVAQPTPPDDELDRLAKPYVGLGGVENYRAYARDVLRAALHQPGALPADPRIAAFYELRDIAERDEDVESASVIASAIAAAGELRKAGALPDDAGLRFAITALQDAQQNIASSRDACWAHETDQWDHYQKGIDAINAALAAKQAAKSNT